MSYIEKLELIETELKDVNSRLVRLYGSLETGKLDLNDLAPRDKELKAKQEELRKTRILTEADLAIHGVQQVDTEQIRRYCADMRRLLSESDIVQSKAFLRSFVEKIVIDGNECTVYYKLPVLANWNKSEELVLPIEPFCGVFTFR